MTTYQINKEKARQKAIEWQQEAEENSFSYEGLAIATAYFERFAKRYGLTEEFKENGII